MTPRPSPIKAGTLTDSLREALDTAELTRYEGDKLTAEDVGFDGIDDLTEAIDVWHVAQTQAVAAKQVERVAAQQLATLLGEGGAVGYGDGVYRYKRGWSERCIDLDGFYDYTTQQVALDEVHLRDVFNADRAKKSWMGDAARDTFFERTRNDEPTLAYTPQDRVPKFLAHLGDGDIFTKENSEPMCTYCGWSGQDIAKHQLVCKHLSDALTEEEK